MRGDEGRTRVLQRRRLDERMDISPKKISPSETGKGAFCFMEGARVKLLVKKRIKEKNA